MTITEVAEKYHISQNPLRYYEQIKINRKLQEPLAVYATIRKGFEMGRVGNLHEKCRPAY